MTRRRRDQSFTQRDLTRAIKAVKAAGINAHIEVDTVHKKITVIPEESAKDGKIDVVTGGATEMAAVENEWDEVYGQNQTAAR